MTTPSFDYRGVAVIWMVATFATACSNLDHEVVPDVASAAVAVDRNASVELAMINVTLRLSAGSQADHTIELWEAWLMQPTRDVSKFQLKLALPGGTLDLDPDDEKVVNLVNVGTTNADLTPLCEQGVDLYVNSSLPRRSDEWLLRCRAATSEDRLQLTRRPNPGPLCTCAP
jgi:hypothetical protein